MLRLKKVVGLFLVLLFFSLVSFPIFAEPQQKGKLVYYFSIYDTGDVNSTLVIQDLSSNIKSAWVLVPKNNTPIILEVLNGTLLNKSISQALTNEGTPYVFYDNLSLTYSGPFSFKVSWNLSYGALIIEPNALFFSPAIGYSKDLDAVAVVELPNITTSILEYYPNFEKKSGNQYTFLPPSDSRIGIAFIVKGTYSQINITSGPFTFRVPLRYKSIAERILDFYIQLYPKFNEIFHINLSSVEVRFFVPKSLNDISLGGFVPIESAVKLGNINLNVFYIRTEKGYFEAISAHELVHYYAFEAGISPSVLWFHEGLANYVGISVSKLFGPGASSTEEDLIGDSNRLKGSDLSFVFKWTPEYTSPNYTLFDHYAVAYYLISSLLKNFSTSSDDLFEGEHFLSNFFKLVTENKIRITSNDQLLRFLFITSNSSNEFTDFFSKYGLLFNISDYFQFTKLNLPSFLTPILLKLEKACISSYYSIIKDNPEVAEHFVEEVKSLQENLENVPMFLIFLISATLVTAFAEMEKSSK